MLQRIFVIVLSALLVSAACGPDAARAQTATSAAAEQARARVEQLGTGRAARVEVSCATTAR